MRRSETGRLRVALGLKAEDQQIAAEIRASREERRSGARRRT